MAGITTFLDPALLPGRTQEQKAFDAAMAYLMQNLPTWGGEVNTTWAAFNAALASLNALAAGGAYAIPYTYRPVDLSATDGNLSFYTTGGLNAATIVGVNKVSGAGANVGPVIETFDDSTSILKGVVRIVAQKDPTRWLMFAVTSLTVYSRYYELRGTTIAASAVNPFVSTDALMLFFQPNGDKGEKGDKADNGFANMLVARTTQSWTAPAGVTKAKITLVDGGYSGGKLAYDATVGSNALGGRGGNASISVRALTPGVTYTLTAGAGGVSLTDSFARPPQAGGTSSFSGAGFTTLTTANGDIIAPGFQPLAGAGPAGGSTLLAPGSSGIGVGGTGGGGSSPGGTGNAGAVILEF